MDEKLSAIEWAQGEGYILSQVNRAKQLVGGGIDHRNGVGVLLGGVDAVTALRDQAGGEDKDKGKRKVRFFYFIACWCRAIGCLLNHKFMASISDF